MTRPMLLSLLLLLGAAPQDVEWRPAQVPGPVAGWVRCWVKVDDSFFSKHERNLFEESVGVNVRGLAGTHEAWVNGRKIGEGGDGLHRHKVPVGTLKKGEWNEIAFHVSAPEGFRGDAPFIMNYFME